MTMPAFPQPDPQLMQALMSRPQLMQLMMQLMQMSATTDPRVLQAAAESQDPDAMARAFGVEPAQFAQLQAVLARELTELAQEYPQVAEMAEQMAGQFGAMPPGAGPPSSGAPSESDTQ